MIKVPNELLSCMDERNRNKILKLQMGNIHIPPFHPMSIISYSAINMAKRIIFFNLEGSTFDI